LCTRTCIYDGKRKIKLSLNRIKERKEISQDICIEKKFVAYIREFFSVKKFYLPCPSCLPATLTLSLKDPVEVAYFSLIFHFLLPLIVT
jgi:hypothetical protein